MESLKLQVTQGTAGMDGYISKPFIAKDMFENIDAVIAKNS